MVDRTPKARPVGQGQGQGHTMFTRARRFLQISRKHPAVIPLVSIVSLAVGFGVLYIGYSLATKNDLRRGIKQQIDLTAIDSAACSKIYNPSPKKESPDLEELREKLYRS
ncbi:unnamed protein product [Lymnaea stagnalis]|uniref:Uncharacterized protein n=1 Tax=Lymnaea stagnalis TaxID=6523 RepID=A0AAV2IEK7_LYMST